MPAAVLSVLALLVVALTGCPGGSAGYGEACERHRDCESALQCTNQTCVLRCQRAPDCGDGYSCGEDGICTVAIVPAGNRCDSEVDCAEGLSCQIDGTARTERGMLAGVCAAQRAGAPAESACVDDNECRNGACALGRCIDLCHLTRDCGAGTSCTQIPRAEAGGWLFEGCFPAQGTVTWQIPVGALDQEIELPVPAGARQVSLVITGPSESTNNSVGAKTVYSPSGLQLFRRCPDDSTSMTCSDADAEARYFRNLLRHRAEIGTSVVALPAAPPDPEVLELSEQLTTGVYRARVASFYPDGRVGAVTPKVTAVLRMGDASTLDLHFHFLDLTEHPCEAAFGITGLGAGVAPFAPYFQVDYLGYLREIFRDAGVSLGDITYEDISNQHALDGLEISDIGKLLALGKHSSGINIFFVRNLSPIGIQAFGPNPGPAGVGGTPGSGIVVGIDTLCYRGWRTLGRITAHEIARYMGLHHNVEIGNDLRDPIEDSNDDPKNLMFYSEHGGTDLSGGQRNILLRSPILR